MVCSCIGVLCCVVDGISLYAPGGARYKRTHIIHVPLRVVRDPNEFE